MDKKKIEDMTVEELKKELEITKEHFQDEEDTYNFSMVKSSVHIGSKQAEAMKEEFEENCREYKSKIEKIKELLKEKE